MILDTAILALLTGFALVGYVNGLIRSFCSLVVPTAGTVLALRNYRTVAIMLYAVIHNHSVALVAAFLLLFLLTWVGARLARRLLLKLFDWRRLEDLDYFLGGVFGLARGLALIWLALAGVLTIFPLSARTMETSRSSKRILALAEYVAGRNSPRTGLVPRLQQRTGAFYQTIATFRNVLDPLTRLEEN